jgi:hypothetical protein
MDNLKIKLNYTVLKLTEVPTKNVKTNLKQLLTKTGLNIHFSAFYKIKFMECLTHYILPHETLHKILQVFTHLQPLEIYT